jgi:glycosyltransferase involved in cell wall biosynthesis
VRILHLNQHGTKVGGVEGYIVDASRALRAAGHDCALAYFEPEEPGDLLPDATWLVVAPTLRDQSEELAEVCRRFRPDVAFLHAVDQPGIVKWLTQSLPTVAYVHAPYPVCPGSGQYLRNSERVCPHSSGLICLANAQLERCCWGRNPWKHVAMLARVVHYKRAYRHVNRIIVGSSYMRKLLIRGGLPDDRVEVLAPVLVSEPLPSFDFRADANTVLFAGRIVSEKGLHHLLKALAYVGDDYRLLVAGDGPDRAECESLAAALGIDSRVTFKGWLDAPALQEELSSCACVALPSLWPEPFGRIGIEAFLHGRPVVAYQVGGISDWLDDGLTGYLVKPGEINALGHCLTNMLTNPGLRLEMSERAQAQAMARWSSSAHADVLQDIFSSLSFS